MSVELAEVEARRLAVLIEIALGRVTCTWRAQTEKPAPKDKIGKEPPQPAA